MNILLFLTLLSTQLPTLKFDPKLQWYTFETPHFSVHFATKSNFAKDEEFAKHIARLCEDVHKKLVPFMRYQPKMKTNLIIADFYDEVTGWASPLPNNTIFISPFFPKTMRVNYYDWLANLIIHEYTHILHLNQSAKLNRILRTIFGQIILPNAIMPTMFHEAYTIFNESEIGILGRGNSSYYQLLLGSQILDNKLFSIDKCVTYNLARYPSGETPYLYGGIFFKYLSEKYSKTKLIDYTHWYSGGLPLFYNVQAKRIFKKSFYQLWKEWQHSIKNDYQTQIAQIKQLPITISAQITFDGFNTSSPVFGTNQLFYLSITNHNYPALKQYDLNQKTFKTLLRKNISSPIGISADKQQLVFSIKDFYKNYYYYDDIYLYDLTNNKLQRLTNGERAFDPDFSPTENKIVFVKSELGQTNLYLLDLATNEISQLTHSEDFTQYAQPRFSPDGKKIAVAIWQLGGYQDIYLYDIATEWLTPITHDKYLDIEPCWTKDGKYLLFVSDRNNIFNIYAYSLEKKEIYQVTNVLTGAFSPAISDDNQKLAFLLHSSKGFDVHLCRINLDSISFQPQYKLSDSLTIFETEDHQISDTIKAELYHYQFMPSILPKFWLPIAFYDQQWYLGGLTYGADALFQHQYYLQAVYNLSTKKPSINANWTINKFRPTIDIIGYYDQGDFGGEIANTFTFRKNENVQYLTQRYLIDRKDYLLSGIGLGYQFSNAKIYPYSISAEQGIGLKLNGTHYNKNIGSDFQLTKINFGISRHQNLPLRHHILMVNLRTNLAFGDSIINRQYQLSVRANDANQKVAKLIGFSCEYRFPLFWIERGFGLFPLFFKSISAKCYYDWAGELKTSPLKLGSQISSIGLELNLNTLIFYELPVDFTIGIGVDPKSLKNPQLYFQFTPSIPIPISGKYQRND